MELDTEERAQLIAYMSKGFQDFDTLNGFVTNKCGRQLNQVTNANAGLAKNFDAVIGWSESDGWLDDFLTALQLHPLPSLRTTAAMTAAALKRRRPYQFQDAGADPFGALFIAREVCFIGRDELRKGLRQLQDPQGMDRVLVVKGERKSGKSYSYQLLRRLDTLNPDNIVVRVDFADFREGAVAARYRDIVNQINMRVGVPFEQMPPVNEAVTRWFEHAVRKFDTVAKERGKRLWLVFDHIAGARGMEDTIADALMRVVKYAIEDSLVLRVVLLDLDPAALGGPRHLVSQVMTDTAALPSRQDIGSYLQRLQRESRVAVSPLQLDAATDSIVLALSSCAQDDRPSVLSEATWQQIELLKLVAGDRA